MDATDVLLERMQEPAGLQRMAVVSLLFHLLLMTVLMLGPRGWFGSMQSTPRTVMTISLGGAGTGPRSGGLTPLGGRPVQVQSPPNEPPKREALRAPAVKTPEMTIPKPGAKPSKALPSPRVKEAPDDARGRTPTKGAETRPGTAVAETGVRGQGFGLSTGGGAGSGSTLDVADFCCPDYLVTMIERIRSSWVQQAEVAGTVVIKFTIERDGRITATTLEKSSGYTALDLGAQRAVQLTRQLPPLPAAFPNPMLTVHLNFQYQR